MGKPKRNVQAYTQEAIKAAESFSHDGYKAIKHMGKVELVNYIHNVYRQGFQDGARAGAAKAHEELTGKKPTILDMPRNANVAALSKGGEGKKS